MLRCALHACIETHVALRCVSTMCCVLSCAVLCCALLGLQGSSGSQVVAGGYRFYKLGTFAWLASAVSVAGPCAMTTDHAAGAATYTYASC
jgi:hypothetical protein